MEPGQISDVRRFNRLVTQRIGALNDHFMGRERPLSQSRVLHEIGRDGIDLRDLRARLGLDSGYLTRIVQALGAQGLVEIEPSRDDERVRTVRLSREGQSEFDEMNRRSDEGAAGLLEPLTPIQRERLVEAMNEVHRLLSLAGLRFEVADPDGDDARRCLDEYARELNERFEEGFAPESILSASIEEFVPPRGAFVLGMLDGRSVACGAIRTLKPRVGYIKRMWVSLEMRGLGVGRRLLEALEHQAQQLGYNRVCLETNRALREAIALYRASGYREVDRFNDEQYADYWFEKSLRRTRSASGRAAR